MLCWRLGHDVSKEGQEEVHKLKPLEGEDVQLMLCVCVWGGAVCVVVVCVWEGGVCGGGWVVVVQCGGGVHSSLALMITSWYHEI